MRSIKPGRGPSAMGAMGSVAAAVFGVFWTVTAASMGAPVFFVLFGFVFIGMAIVQGFYHFKNATGRNRMSVFDITDSEEEPDPLSRFGEGPRAGRTSRSAPAASSAPERINFCPYCGTPIKEESHRYCVGCGKEIR